jgi:hypothetical protein
VTEFVDVTYRPGAGLAIVGARLVVLLPSQAEPAVARCWPLVRDGARWPVVIDELTRDLGDSPTDLVLVALGEGDEPTRAVVRGRAVLETIGSDGASRTTSAGPDGEFVHTEVVGVTVRVGFDISIGAEGRVYPVAAGVIWTDAVQLTLPAVIEAMPLPELIPEPVPELTPPPVTPEPVPAPIAAESPAAVIHSGPPVHAVVCPLGHLSPPYAPQCRVCGTAVPPQEPFVTSRPSLGLLRLSTGEVVPLDRTVVLGRNPRTEDTGPSGPLIVTVPSPNKDISRSHVEVRLEDWNVLVTDLGSTNGTTVTVPGHPPVRLRANEPMPIESQTEVNIADEVVFRYEVT